MEEKIYVGGATQLHIRTVTGMEFDVIGKNVYYIEYEEDGKIYYCNGRSFPENIVTSIK